VPQERIRVFYFGTDKTTPSLEFPKPTFSPKEFRTVRQALEGLPSPPMDHTPCTGDLLHRRTRLSAKNLRRLGLIPPGGGFENLPVELRADCHKIGAKKIGHRYVYGRLDPARPAGTITARFDSFTRGKFAHPFENRNITLREGARLQTFPDEFKFVGTQEQIASLIGNAVPPLLAEIIGRAIRIHLSGRENTKQLKIEQCLG
jgi:DNA (cytosine-5)-methyltransferase 1